MRKVVALLLFVIGVVGAQTSVGTLNGPITATSTSIPVNFTAFLGGQSVVTIDSEQILVCNVTGFGISPAAPTWQMTMTPCTNGRGFNATTPASHAAGASVLASAAVQGPGTPLISRGAGAFPQSCNAGDLFYRTDQTAGQNLWVCGANSLFHPGAGTPDLVAPALYTAAAATPGSNGCTATLQSGSTNLAGVIIVNQCSLQGSSAPQGSLLATVVRDITSIPYPNGSVCHVFDLSTQTTLSSGFPSPMAFAAYISEYVYPGDWIAYACQPF